MGPLEQLRQWLGQRLWVEGASGTRSVIPVVQAPEPRALGDTAQDLALPPEQAEAGGHRA